MVKAYILKKLAGGDKRSIGRVDEVIEDVLNEPSLFQVLIEGVLDDDPIIRMRCADAVEKISSKRPEYLQPYKQRLIEEIAKIEQQEVKWHVAQMFPRLDLTPEERAVVFDILLNYLNDRSRIVKTFSMQALADLTETDATLRPKVIQILEELTKSGSPAMKSRGKKLLAKLQKSRSSV